VDTNMGATKLFMFIVLFSTHGVEFMCHGDDAAQSVICPVCGLRERVLSCCATMERVYGYRSPR
jgi:hypothetical protein